MSINDGLCVFTNDQGCITVDKGEDCNLSSPIIEKNCYFLSSLCSSFRDGKGCQ